MTCVNAGSTPRTDPSISIALGPVSIQRRKIYKCLTARCDCSTLNVSVAPFGQRHRGCSGGGGGGGGSGRSRGQNNPHTPQPSSKNKKGSASKSSGSSDKRQRTKGGNQIPQTKTGSSEKKKKKSKKKKKRKSVDGGGQQAAHLSKKHKTK